MKDVRVLYMGKEISLEDLPEPQPSLEAYFKPVMLSPQAIDRCSQIVPDEYWKPLGIHTWLAKRADFAFSKLGMSQSEIKIGRLKYVFEVVNDVPILQKLILI